MAVVSMMRFSGDADDLARRIRDHIDPVTERLASKHGSIARFVCRLPHDEPGVLVINVWQSDHGRHEMAREPAILAALEAAGLPRPSFVGYDIISHHLDATAFETLP